MAIVRICLRNDYVPLCREHLHRPAVSLSINKIYAHCRGAMQQCLLSTSIQYITVTFLMEAI